jgi:hypothetical protein
MPEACGTFSIITTARISLNVRRAFFFPGKNNGRHGLHGYSQIYTEETSVTIRANPWLRSYPAKLFTNSTRLRRAMPDGPFAIHGF